MYIAAIGALGSETLWARIGRVRFSKTGRTLYYDGRGLRGGHGYFRDAKTGEYFHIQRARHDGMDRSEGRKLGSFRVMIDDDVREEYWRKIRGEPNRRTERFIHS
jgi:hypothetical protein